MGVMVADGAGAGKPRSRDRDGAWHDGPMRRAAAALLLALGALLGLASAAPARSTTLTPREIRVAVGDEAGFMLLSNARSGHRWRWITSPNHAIARPLPVQQIPMNDIVNGPAGRVTVYVIGRAPGATRGVVGYFAPGASKPTKLVPIRIVVQAG
jgi:hypothetical protein